MTTFNSDQQAAVSAMLDFLSSPQRFFVLSGAAGTGKTFCVKHLIESTKQRIVFTAPTNKATKVLRSTLTTDTYFPICRTTYSLLGLRLEPSGEVKKLVANPDAVDLTKVHIIIVDEASMISQTLWQELVNASDNFAHLKFIFMGDANQLPPVKEVRSPIWDKVSSKSELRQVMRFDNQILGIAEKIKSQVDSMLPRIDINGCEDNDGAEGIWVRDSSSFVYEIMTAAKQGDFSNGQRLVKAIAWRNAIVSRLNQIIRGQIFDNSADSPWMRDDRIILTAPANNLEGQPMASTDEEGTIEAVYVKQHPQEEDIKCFNILAISDDNKKLDLWVLHSDSYKAFNARKTHLAAEAKRSPRMWKDYWQFVDTFHQIQYGYAITAHRAQGSTYDTAYVVWNDILLNRNRNEAFRCLYVACTRAKRKLILGKTEI